MHESAPIQDNIKKILTHYGHQNQQVKTIEELGELASALARDLLHEDKSLDTIDEIADVAIMILQMAIAYGSEAVDRRIEFKVNRTVASLNVERHKY